MRKLISIILCIMLAASIATISITANAAQWSQSARKVELNSTFSDEFTESDYRELHGDNAPYYVYYDSFYFTVPAKGTVKLRVECETETAHEDVGFSVRSSKNINDYVWEETVSNSTVYGYDPGRDVYYDEWSITLNAGSYYLVAEQGIFWRSLSTDTIEYSLTYKPKFSNTSIVSKTAKKKAFKVSWQKASGVTGYQLQYSLKSSMKSAKTVTINKQSTITKTITKLKAKKKYYVRVRTYKKMIVEGVNHTYYGKWSAKKSITTKK